MRYRILGRTGLTVSALALGTVELGLDYGIKAPGHFGRPSQDTAVRLVNAALDAGINFFDTARAYGDSERILGLALEGRRDQAILVTKVDPRPPAGVLWSDEQMRDVMQDALETSLRLLRTDRVDIWMIHNVDAALLARRDLLAGVFQEARRAGQIGWTGASFYGATLPEESLGHDLFDVMQVTYSVLDQRLSAQVLPLAAEKNVGIVARSVLLKGVLTVRAEHLPARLDLLRLHSRRFRALIQEAGEDVTAAQGAIAFALAHPQIDTVLVGTRSTDELAEDLAALEVAYSASTLDKLGALALEDEELLDPTTWGIP